jgi:RNA polymerase sigma factor (sigma-70 family)
MQASHLDGLTDAELLERFVRSHDEAAFAVLVHRHGRLVWSACWQTLRHQQDAEDAYQAAFLVLVRHAGTIRRGQTVACWLYQVAGRIPRKAARDRARRRERVIETSAVCGKSIEQELTWRELQALVHGELARLPEKYQALFVLCCLDGKSKSQAACQLGWKEGTLSSRLAHARKHLRQRLARQGVELTSVLIMTELVRRPGAAPAGLTKSTLTTASRVLTGQSLSGVLSPQVAVLMPGVVKTMFLSKLKGTFTVLLTLCLIGAGTGALAWPRRLVETLRDKEVVPAPGEPAAENVDAPPAPAAKSASASWLGIASRETNAGPELAIRYEDGSRRTIQASADTVLLSYLADYPLGGHEVLSVDLADTNRVLLRFDLPDEGRVQRAELVLSRSQNRHPSPSEPVRLAVHEVQQSWTEAQATWNRQPRFSRRPALTAQVQPSEKEYHIDVSMLVRRVVEGGAPNRGWLLRVDRPLVPKPSGEAAEVSPPAGWSCRGSDYVFAVDGAVRHGGNRSCRIEARSPDPTGYAMMSQLIRADDYRGRRIRLSGFAKSAKLTGTASLWMRIDGDRELLAIDKTIQQAVRGTSDWRRLEIVLDVPEPSKLIRFAALVEGTGKRGWPT